MLTLDSKGIEYANLYQDIKTLLMPKNWIINGMFDVWQRGVSQTISGYGSDDRFINAQAISTKTHSQQVFTVGQTNVPNNPKYFSRTVVVSGNTVDSITIKYQKIEDVTKLAGKTVSVSFWAKANASKNLSIEFGQDFGTGGSSQVNTLGVQKFALTTSWQRFTKTVTFPSVSGKTIGVGHSTFLTFYFDAGSNYNAITDSLGNQSGTFDIANVSLVEGSVAVECQNQPYADVLRECQRYYRDLIFGVDERLPITHSTSGTTRARLNYLEDMRIVPIASIKTDATIKIIRDVTDGGDATFTTITFQSFRNSLEIIANVSMATAHQMLIFNLVIALSAEL